MIDALADGNVMAADERLQTAIALRILFARGEISRALVVAPASLRLNWLRELRRWAPMLPVRAASGNR